VRNWFMGSALTFAAVFTFVLVTSAQADKPASANAGARPAPFDPRDFSGIWNPVPSMQPKDEPPVTFGRAFTKNDLLPAFTPAGEAKYEANAKFIAAGDVLDCDPYGTARNFFTPRPFEILLTRDRWLQHFEYYDNWREIWTDGRKIPGDVDSDYMGFSVGRWNGDTFIVESAAYNGKQFLSWSGLPQSESMHQTERWQRLDQDTLKIVFTFDDPKYYAKPWTIIAFWKLKKDWVLDAHPCTLSAIKEYDERVNHVDKIPGLDYGKTQKK
jgi:hypothetical protein